MYFVLDFGGYYFAFFFQSEVYTNIAPIIAFMCVWLALNLIGVYLILNRKDSLTRMYQILYNGLFAGLFALLLFGNYSESVTNLSFKFAIDYGICCLYWIVSIRVKATYPKMRKVTAAAASS